MAFVITVKVGKVGTGIKAVATIPKIANGNVSTEFYDGSRLAADVLRNCTSKP